MCIVYAHNNCVSALVETGAVGLGALLCIFYRMIGEARQALRTGTPASVTWGPVVFVIAAPALRTLPFLDIRAMFLLGMSLGICHGCSRSGEYAPGAGGCHAPDPGWNGLPEIGMGMSGTHSAPGERRVFRR